jgi:plastocyanin
MTKVGAVSLVLACALAAARPLAAGTIDGRVLRASGRSLAGFVISIEDIRGGFPPPKEIAVMDQRELRFVPHVLVVLAGTTVEFPNSDVVSHNVFSISESKRFNLGLYVRGSTRRLTFAQPGIVELLCNVHLEMSGYIVVLANPYFSRVGSDGAFHIAGVPPGRHRLRCWSEATLPQEIDVDVPATGTVTADFSVRE